MKIKHIGPSTSGRLLFNDLGKVTKGVAPDEQHIALDYLESLYLPDSGEVLFSAQKGDIKRYAGAGLLEVNEPKTLANAAALTMIHNFNYVPNVTAVKKSGVTWIQAVCGVDYTAVTNAALTETVFTNISGGALDFIIRIT
jgi:hypothetical protein